MSWQEGEWEDKGVDELEHKSSKPVGFLTVISYWKILKQWLMGEKEVVL